jgi:PAS domain S-box-containing protein
MTAAPDLPSEPVSDDARALRILDSMPGFAWSADPSGRFTYFSPSTLTFLGQVPKELNMTEDEDEFGWRRVVHPDDYDRVAARWRHCLKTGEHYDTEHRLRRSDGVYRWFRNSGRPSRDSQGRIAQWYGTTLDIEDQKRAEAALHDRERELSQLVNMVPSHVWCLTPGGEPTFFNKRMVDYLGLDVADKDWLGMSRLDALIATVHPDDAARFRDTLTRSLATGDSFVLRYRLRRADGVFRWMSSRAEPLRDEEGGIVQWYGLCHDIDDQVHAEEAVRQSEHRLQQMIDVVPAHIWCMTPEGKLSYINKRFIDTLGVTLADLTAPDGSRSLADVHPDDRNRVEQSLARSVETGETFAMAFRQRRADESYRWVEGRGEPLRDETGSIVQWYGVCVDIDDQVTAQEALHHRERELSQLVDLVPVHIRRLSPEGEPTFFNKQLIDFFGLDLADLEKPGASRLVTIINSLVHPDDADGLLAAVRRSVATGEPYAMKYRMRRADGVYRWVDGRAEPLRDQYGTIVQWYAISIDIDDEMRAQEALRDRERELSQLVNMVPSYLWRLSPDGTPGFFNQRLIDFLGLDIAGADKPDTSRLEALIVAAVHPDDAAGLKEAFNHSFATGERFSRRYRLRRVDGAYRWVEGSAEPLRDERGRIIQWYGLTHDIDDQLRVEEALRQSERQLQQLIDTVPVQIWCVTPAGEPAYINKAMMDYIGLKLEDFDAQGGLPSAINTIVHPDDRPALQQALSHSFRTGESFELKFRNLRWDGSYRWQEGRADPLRDENGRIIRWYGANVDIHDFETAQEALRARERSLWQLVETLPIMIDCAAPDGEPLYRSKQLRDFLGYELDALDGTGKGRLDGTLDAGVHPDDLVGVKENYAYSLATGEPYARKHRLRRFDGEYRWVDTRATPMRNAEGEIVQWNVACLDIDGEMRAQEELRLARERLARASQEASLAELSASIAHEVNQPLAAIVANSNACQRWLMANPPNLERAQKTVERIVRDANSAADVVSRIRALFKQSIGTRTRTALSSVMAEAQSLMAEEAARRRVRLDVEVESHLPLVAIDRIQLQQVLVNLIRNGMDAMDAVQGDKVLGIRVRQMGGAVQIEVSDRGQGIEFPEKIFEPFFSTKENGMGMGLAICRSIVESHGGRLWSQANDPQGARFIFTLPVDLKPDV